jgi:riboflavin synthase
MFTGIIESLGVVLEIEKDRGNRNFKLTCGFVYELKVDQSLSHNGVCLTVMKIEGNSYWVTAIEETLAKTNLGFWKIGDKINLERCMLANGRFDGHIVQGHVDQTAVCSHINDQAGSWLIGFDFDPETGNLTVEKGSICVNGVSLTVVHSRPGFFSVAIIPYTWEHTNFHQFNIGTVVNLEFDIVGKYIRQMVSSKNLGT